MNSANAFFSASVAVVLSGMSVFTASAATFKVTTTASSGAGSFKEAFASAAASKDASNTITFDQDKFTGPLDSRIINVKSVFSTIGSGRTLIIDGKKSGARLDAGKLPMNGRVFTVEGGRLELRSLSMQSMPNGTWVTVSKGGTVEIGGCCFESNGDAGSGSVVHVMNHDAKAVVRQSTFARNTAMNDGGALCCSGGATLVVDHCTFHDNLARQGGAIYFRGTEGSLFVNACTFIGNVASGIKATGGAVDIDSSSAINCSVFNSIFLGNTADGGGNAVYNGGATAVTLIGCVHDSGALGFKKVGFSAPRGSNVGDATMESVFGSSKPVAFRDDADGVARDFFMPKWDGVAAAAGYFIMTTADWTAAKYGEMRGRVATWAWNSTGKCTERIEKDIRGREISAVRRPAAGSVECEGKDLVVTRPGDTVVDDGHVTLREALVYAERFPELATDGRMRITFSLDGLADPSASESVVNFGRNEARAIGSAFAEKPLLVEGTGKRRIVLDGGESGFRAFGLGGGAQAEFKGLTFRNYASELDGSVFSVVNASLTLTDCVLSDNRVKGEGKGGAVCIREDGRLKCENCRFAGNRGDAVGALNLQGGTSDLRDVTFSGNVSPVSAGAILNAGGACSVVNGTFRSNNSGARGAIYARGGVCHLGNVTVSCTVGAAALYVGGDVARFVAVNSIFRGADSRAGITVEPGAAERILFVGCLADSTLPASAFSQQCNFARSVLAAGDLIVSETAKYKTVNGVKHALCAPGPAAVGTGVLTMVGSKPTASFGYWAPGFGTVNLVGKPTKGVKRDIAGQDFETASAPHNNYAIGSYYTAPSVAYTRTWDEAKETGILTGCAVSGELPADFFVPGLVGGVRIVRIGENLSDYDEVGLFSGSKTVEKITLADEIKDMHVNTFNDCTALAQVVLGAGFNTWRGNKSTSSPRYYFKGCTKLKSVTATAAPKAKGLCSSGGAVYQADEAGTKPDVLVFLPPAYPKKTLAPADFPATLTGVGSAGFCGNAKTVQITVPAAAVANFGGLSLRDAVALADLRFDASSAGSFDPKGAEGTPWYKNGGYLLNADGTKLLKVCGKPTSLAGLPATVTEIGAGACQGLTSLTAVEIPSRVVSIGTDAFRNCSNLATVTFAAANPFESLRRDAVGTGAFDGTAWGAAGGLVIDAAGVLLGYYGTVPATLTLPSTVRRIGAEYADEETGAFENCRTLVTLRIPSSVERIGEYAFYNCSNLETVELIGTKPGLKSVAVGAFAYTPWYSKITDGSTDANVILGPVSPVGRCFYVEYTGINPVVDASAALRLNDDAFDENAAVITGIVLPTKAVAYGEEGGLDGRVFYNLFNLASLEFDGGADAADNYWIDGQGILYTKDKRVLICCPRTKTGTVKIPASVREIASYAFRNCRVTGISGGDKVETIGFDAFEGCAAGDPFTDRAELVLAYNDEATPDASVRVKVGAAFDLPVPTRAGFAFSGWEWNGKTYGQTFKPTAVTTYRLEGRWTEIAAAAYVIEYHANGGEGGVISEYASCGTPQPLAANAFTRQGYGFLGWAFDPAAATPDFGDRDVVVDLAPGGQAVSLYAVWAALVPYPTDKSAFSGSAASTWTGYLRKKGAECVGTVSVSVGAWEKKNGKYVSAVTATVTYTNGKKLSTYSYKSGSITKGSNTVKGLVGADSASKKKTLALKLYSKAFSGSFGDYEIVGAKKATPAKTAYQRGFKILVGGAAGGALFVNVDSKGKATVSGTSGGGDKVSTTVQSIVAKDYVLVPVATPTTRTLVRIGGSGDVALIGGNAGDLLGAGPTEKPVVEGYEKPAYSAVGIPYSGKVLINDFTDPVTYSATDLPPGLSIGKSSGAITGIPARKGSYKTKITVTSKVNANWKATKTVTIRISAIYPWLKGSFQGYGSYYGKGEGLARMTIDSTGKASGKIVVKGTAYSFPSTAAYKCDYDAKDDSIRVYYKVKVNKTYTAKFRVESCRFDRNGDGYRGEVVNVDKGAKAVVEGWQDVFNRSDLLLPAYPATTRTATKEQLEMLGLSSKDVLVFKFAKNGGDVTISGTVGGKAVSASARPGICWHFVQGVAPDSVHCWYGWLGFALGNKFHYIQDEVYRDLGAEKGRIYLYGDR